VSGNGRPAAELTTEGPPPPGGGPSRPTHDRATSALLLLGAALGFGALGPLATIAYDAGMSAPTFVALRAGIGGLILVGALIALPRPTVRLTRLPRREQVMLGVAIALNGGFNLALFGAFGSAPVPVVLAIVFTYPAIVAGASAALGRERLTRLRLIGLALASVGVVLILSDRMLGASVGPIGVALAVLAAVAQAGYIVVARAGFPTVPAEQATVLVLFGGLVMALPLAAATWAGAAWALDLRVWGAVAAASLFGTALAKVWVLRGVRALGSTRAAVLLLAEPLFGTMLAAVALGQVPTAGQALGAALVIAASIAVQRPAPGRAAVGPAD